MQLFNSVFKCILLIAFVFLTAAQCHFPKPAKSKLKDGATAQSEGTRRAKMEEEKVTNVKGDSTKKQAVKLYKRPEPLDMQKVDKDIERMIGIMNLNEWQLSEMDHWLDGLTSKYPSRSDDL